VTISSAGPRPVRLLLAGLVVALLFGLVSPPARAAAAQDGCPAVTRVRGEGDDQVSRAALLARMAFPRGADTVVLARVDRYADALSGGPLATQLRAPVLLTDGAALTGTAGEEIERLGATTAVLLGGPEALSTRVEEELEARGIGTIVRHGGGDRFATSQLVAEQVLRGSGADRAYLALGSSSSPAGGWPDALAVSALAAGSGRPILLTQKDSLPPATRAALERVGGVTVVGGEVAVSGAVAAEVSGLGVRTDRVGGADRYETARMITERALAEGRAATPLYLVTGAAFADALVSGPVAAARGGILLLTDDRPWEENPAAAFLRAHPGAVREVVAVGSSRSLPDGLLDRVCAALTAPAPPADPSPPPPAAQTGVECTGPVTGPRTITAGGVYTVNVDAAGHGVTIDTAEPVTLRGCVRATGRAIHDPADDQRIDLTVEQYRGEWTGTTGDAGAGRFLRAELPKRLVITRSELIGSEGIIVVGDGSATDMVVRVNDNYAENIRQATRVSPYAQFVQLYRVVGDTEILRNVVRNEQGRSLVEDTISLYLSRGTPDNPIEVAWNDIRGGYSGSGSGIMLDGPDLAQIKDVWIHHNRMVNVANVGIGLAGVDEAVTVEDNCILKLAGQPGALGDLPAYVWDWDGDGTDADFGQQPGERPLIFRNNKLGWVKADGSRPDPWFPGGSQDQPVEGSGNVKLPDPITESSC
jgi:putative cell wall-binding protein